MTDEEMRIAIAEACGWHEEKEPVGSAFATAWWHHNDRYPSYLMPLPDYLNDLNAMHEAEKVLTENQWSKYVALLTGRDWICDRVITSDAAQQAIHATARQRCLAFLKTLNLWKD